MSNTFSWGNFVGDNFIDIIPVDGNGQAIYEHSLDTGECWCSPKIEYEHPDGDALILPLVIHDGRER